jgi:hypothetical protein
MRFPDLVTRAKSELFLILALLGSTAVINLDDLGREFGAAFGAAC